MGRRGRQTEDGAALKCPVEEGEGVLGLSVRLGVERQRNGRGSWNLREKEEQRFGNGPGE